MIKGSGGPITGQSDLERYAQGIMTINNRRPNHSVNQSPRLHSTVEADILQRILGNGTQLVSKH